MVAEPEIGREVGAHRIGIEHHCIERRCKRVGKCGLAGARQTHNKDFSISRCTCSGNALKSLLDVPRQIKGAVREIFAT